jgi:hypothetical protein
MGINTAILSMLGAMLLWMSVRAFLRVEDGKEPNLLPWVPIDVRKTKVYVSQTRDAGMYIERQRRTAIIGNPTLKPSYQGSTNGSLESFLTAICVCPPRAVCPPEPLPVVWSNGDADDEICDVVDAGGAFGGYEAVDSGGAVGNVCGA